jgi:hypothetical protein
MNNYNTNFDYKQVNSKLILSDPDYQRQIDFNRVKKIAASFNENLVNPIKVSFRCGKYYVFDGQHTLAALKMLNNNSDLMVDCKVYYGLTKRQEAELFSQQNGISRNVETIAKLKALYVAGDVDVVNMVRLTAMSGLYINFTKGRAFNKIVAVSKAFQIYKNTNEQEYIHILSLIKDAWLGMPESLSTEVLGGTYIFDKVYKGRYSDRIFASQLYKTNPLEIIRDGKLSPLSGDSKYARQILISYNKGLRTNRLNDEILVV